MEPAHKMTAQGVRDLNHHGPKEKMAAVADPAVAPAEVFDAAPAAITLASPPNDESASAPTVDNG